MRNAALLTGIDYTSPSVISLPLYETRVAAGSPAPAEEAEQPVTLNDILLHNPRATFLLRVTGDSMIDAGINDGDLLTVDQKLTARNGDIIVACIDGQTTVKKLQQLQGAVTLLPQNKNYPPISITDGNDFMILGVVTNVIHALY